MDWESDFQRSKGGRPVAYEDDTRPLSEPDLLPAEKLQRTPLEQLSSHWMNERHAPDILPAQENLLAHLLDHLRRQVRPIHPRSD